MKTKKGKGMDYNKRLLYAAVMNNMNDVIRYSKLASNLNYRDSDGNSPLSAAIENNNTNMVMFLLSQKATVEMGPESTTMFHYAFINGNYRVFDRLLVHNYTPSMLNKSTPMPLLHMLVTSEDTRFLERFLEERHMNINIQDPDGNTILHKHSTPRYLYERMIENGFNLNIKNKIGEYVFDSFLSYVSNLNFISDDIKVISYLFLRHKARISTRNSLKTLIKHGFAMNTEQLKMFETINMLCQQDHELENYLRMERMNNMNQQEIGIELKDMDFD